MSELENITVREAARRRHPLDGANAQALEAALAGVEQLLGNLLADIHGDGGHHQSRHGLEASCRAAHQRIAALRVEVGELKVQISELSCRVGEAVGK